MEALPVSAIVPTYNRTKALWKTLTSLEDQQTLPTQLIVVDASDDSSTQEMVIEFARRVSTFCSVRWVAAERRGAAAQRNQGVLIATQPVIWFFDDDIQFEPECVSRLWRALHSDPRLGGVNAMIRNQCYQKPGRLSRNLFGLLHGSKQESYAGMCIGPALNLLPEDSPDLPLIVPVEWLNTTCVLYKRNVLPHPPFSANFIDYSLMEDLALSLTIGQKWKLANARTARIIHDSQPGNHKNSRRIVARMSLVNRHYVMTQILGRTRLSDYVKLGILESFGIVTSLYSSAEWIHLPASIIGKCIAIKDIIKTSFSENT